MALHLLHHLIFHHPVTPPTLHNDPFSYLGSNMALQLLCQLPLSSGGASMDGLVEVWSILRLLILYENLAMVCVCSLMVMVYMCVLTDGDRVETGCGTLNESIDSAWYLWWLITSKSKHIFSQIRLWQSCFM